MRHELQAQRVPISQTETGRSADHRAARPILRRGGGGAKRAFRAKQIAAFHTKMATRSKNTANRRDGSIRGGKKASPKRETRHLRPETWGGEPTAHEAHEADEGSGRARGGRETEGEWKKTFEGLSSRQPLINP